MRLRGWLSWLLDDEQGKGRSLVSCLVDIGVQIRPGISLLLSFCSYLQHSNRIEILLYLLIRYCEHPFLTTSILYNGKMRYAISRPSEYLLLTGAGVKDIEIKKKALVMPWQRVSIC